MKKRILAALAGAAAVALILSGCGGGNPMGSDSSGGSSGSAITIGSANFPESELIAEMYAEALEGQGVSVERKFNIGARELYMKALSDGSIDLLPEYNGALLDYLMPNGVPQDVTKPDQVYDALQKVMPEGIITLPQSEAQDKDTLSVTKDTADKYNLKKISDLTGKSQDLVLGGSPEFQTRYQGLIGLKDLYGLEFKSFTPLDAGGPLTVKALADGDIQVGDIFSTDSSIKTKKFVVLDDDKNLFTSQNVLPIIRSSKASDKVKSALNSVSKKLTTKNLSSYLAEVQVDKKDSKTVAGEFLKKYKIKTK